MLAKDRLYERGPAHCQSVVLPSPRRGYALRGGILGSGGDGFHHWVVVAMRRIVIGASLIFVLIEPRVLRSLVYVRCHEEEVPKVSAGVARAPRPQTTRQLPAPIGITKSCFRPRRAAW